MTQTDPTRSQANSPVWNMLLVPYEEGQELPRRRGAFRRSDTEGRRVRQDGRPVIVAWPLTDFDGYLNSPRTAAVLAWRFYVDRPARWFRWAVGDAWDPHGERRSDMSSGLDPEWWAVPVRPLVAAGRWVHRHCRREGLEEEHEV